MIKINTSKARFITLIIFWIPILILSFYSINFFVANSIFNVAFLFNDSLYSVAIIPLLLSIILTTFVAYGGKISKDKEGFINAIILNTLIVFIFIVFYQCRIASIGSGNLSLDTIYNAREMSAFEYNTFYTQSVMAFFDIALKKILIAGMVLLGLVGVIMKLFKKD